MMVHCPQEFTFGISEMDVAQQKTFEKVNQLINDCEKGRGTEQTHDLLNFLKVDLVQQFKCEETLMRACHYPERLNHQRMHADFIRRIRSIENELVESHGSQEALGALNETFIDWLFDHVCLHDRALGDFIRSPGRCAASDLLKQSKSSSQPTHDGR